MEGITEADPNATSGTLRAEGCGLARLSAGRELTYLESVRRSVILVPALDRTARVFVNLSLAISGSRVESSLEGK